MAFDQAHNLLTFGGTITAGVDAEVWQSGLRFGNGNYLMGQSNPLGPDASTTAILNQIKADLVTWWDANSGIFSNAAKMTWLKFNAIGTDGNYIDQQETYEAFFTPVKQGNASGSLPPQIATAVTFRTNASRGLAARGRMYLPPLGPSASVGAGRLAHERRDQFASTTATLLTNLGNWAGLDAGRDPGRPCVMSNVGAGATRRINRVDCGDVFDTLRSRRNRLNEVRSPEFVVTT